MIGPDDVTDAMVEVLHEKYDIAGRIGTPTKVAARVAIAAAINASGCVLVRRELLEDLRDDALQSAIVNEHFKCHPTKDSRYAEPLARAIQVAAMLADADPRQQALDRMAENAQELGLYDEGKEKGDE